MRRRGGVQKRAGEGVGLAVFKFRFTSRRQR